MSAMIRSRAPRDGDRSPAPALPDSCRAIGHQLTAARDTRQLSVEAIASKLLLSKGQILGLEHADPSAFYSTDYFLRGLRKYMALMDLPTDLLDDPEEEGGLRLMLADTAGARGRLAAGRSHSWIVPATAALVVLSAGLVTYLSRTGLPFTSADVESDTVSLVVASPLPSQPIQVPAATPLPVRAQPASALISGGEPDSTVRVSVGKATWVFIRYPDNSVVERRLAAGEEIEVGPMPVYLAVGTAESVEVLVEDRPVALQPYIRNGQVRLTKPDLARLRP
jgi:hypothetical protein